MTGSSSMTVNAEEEISRDIITLLYLHVQWQNITEVFNIAEAMQNIMNVYISTECSTVSYKLIQHYISRLCYIFHNGNIQR